MTPFNINPQWVVFARALLLIFGGALTSWGLVSKEQLAMLTDTATLTAVLASVGTLATLGWSLWSHRPKGIAAMAGETPGIHAVIADPSIADSSKTPDNVVASVNAAAALPGVPRG